MPKHYLITGGAGFIGSHLAEHLLQEGHKITIMDDFNDYYEPSIKIQNISRIRNHIQLLKGDIRDPNFINKSYLDGKFDHIIHLAARAGVRPSISDPKLYYTTNIDGTFNLLEACRAHGVGQFTFASSSSVYGINKKVPFSETDTLERTISPYAATKLAGEQICSNYSYLFGIQCQCLRFFTVYGPRQRPDLAIAKFTKHIIQGLPIQQYGDGSAARDYTYIDDIISGVIAASKYEKSDFEIFNLGGSATTTLTELIGMIEAATEKKAVIELLPDQPGDVPRTYADVSKSAELINYIPRTPISVGISKYVKWYTEQSS
jgi:UDP-glucuronate 4-epimerase